LGVVEVDIGISKRSAGDRVSADTDGGDRTDAVEKFEQDALRNKETRRKEMIIKRYSDIE
jgi:hypothetical protein